MNRFPTINYYYTESSGRSLVQYSSSNGNVAGRQSPSNYQPQPSGQGGGGVDPHSFYQNGNYSNIPTSSSPRSTWEQQVQQQSAQNFYSSGGYAGYQHQQAHASYQGQELQAHFLNRGYISQQQQYCAPNIAHQYNLTPQQNQFQGYGQQHPSPTQFEQQNMVQHYHPYQRPIHPQSQQQQQQPRRTTGFLEQLLENKSSSRASYPYRQGAQKAASRIGITPSAGVVSNFPAGYGSVSSVARPNSSRPRHRSAFVATGSQMRSAPSNNPAMNRNVPVNLTINGNGVNTASVNKEGGMLRELLKSKAGERFKRNTTLFEEILDEKIVETNPSVVTTQRLNNLKTQVNLLSGELNKQKEDVDKTKEACEKELEEFKTSNQAFTSAYDKLCKPISQETYRELIDKYYYDIKDSGKDAPINCDCSDNQETSEVKPIKTEKMDLERVTIPITPPSSSNGDDEDSSTDLIIIGEIPNKPKLNPNLMNEGWGSYQPYSERSYTNQNSEFNRAPLQVRGSTPSQAHFDSTYQSELYAEKMQMPNSLRTAPSPAHCGTTGGLQSFPERSQAYDIGNYNYEPITPPPQLPYPVPCLIPDWRGEGLVKTFPSSWSSYPSPATNHPGKGFGEMLEQQHPEGQALRDLREKPSEELRNFLIKLVKQKCGEDWRALRKFPDVAEYDKLMTRSSGGGGFFGGGVMEVKKAQPPPALPLPLQLPPCDWLRDDLMEDDKSKFDQEQKQEKVNTEESTSPDFASLIEDDDDDDEGRLIIAEADEDDTNNERDVVTPEAVIKDASGSSKLTELLDKPLTFGNRNNGLKKVEIALDSEQKQQIGDNAAGEGIEENPEKMPFGIAGDKEEED